MFSDFSIKNEGLDKKNGWNKILIKWFFVEKIGENCFPLGKSTTNLQISYEYTNQYEY